MTERIFVDTNVFVYARDRSHRGKQIAASAALEQLWRERAGRTSVQVLNELYVTLTRKLAHRMSAEDAWEVIEPLLAWDPQPIDRGLMQRAHGVERRYQISWWDSLIVAAALLQDCDVLLSEDLQAGMAFERLVVRNPFAAGVQELRPTYARDELPSRHRPRGRPRKQPQAMSGPSET